MSETHFAWSSGSGVYIGPISFAPCVLLPHAYSNSKSLVLTQHHVITTFAERITAQNIHTHALVWDMPLHDSRVCNDTQSLWTHTAHTLYEIVGVDEHTQTLNYYIKHAMWNDALRVCDTEFHSVAAARARWLYKRNEYSDAAVWFAKSRLPFTECCVLLFDTALVEYLQACLDTFSLPHHCMAIAHAVVMLLLARGHDINDFVTANARHFDPPTIKHLLQSYGLSLLPYATAINDTQTLLELALQRGDVPTALSLQPSNKHVPRLLALDPTATLEYMKTHNLHVPIHSLPPDIAQLYLVHCVAPIDTLVPAYATFNPDALVPLIKGKQYNHIKALLTFHARHLLAPAVQVYADKGYLHTCVSLCCEAQEYVLAKEYAALASPDSQRTLYLDILKSSLKNGGDPLAFLDVCEIQDILPLLPPFTTLPDSLKTVVQDKLVEFNTIIHGFFWFIQDLLRIWLGLLFHVTP